MRPIIFSSYPIAEEANSFFLIKNIQSNLSECIALSSEMSAPFTVISDTILPSINNILESIISATLYNPDIILLDINDFKYTVQLDRKNFWVDNFKKSKLLVINRSLYESILNTEPINWDKLDLLSRLTTKKILCFPLLVSNFHVNQKLEMYNSKNILFKRI